jgi:AraC family transcriptional regulator
MVADELAVDGTKGARSLHSSVLQQYSVPAHRALAAQTLSSEPIGIARLIMPPVSTQMIPSEKSYGFHVYMAPHGIVDAWIDGKHVRVPAGRAGDIAVADFEVPQVGDFHEAMDVLHIRFPKSVLADLAYDRGVRYGKRLRTILGGVADPILYSLACALAEKIDDYGVNDRLFVDHVALAFHAHAVRAYSDEPYVVPTKGMLAPWQLRRSCDIMLADVNGDVTLAELAQACGLSVSYFARAFRQTTGVPPHRWLIAQRVNKAKGLLKNSGLSTVEVALMCGFADQSHFNRAFCKFENSTPARWRTINREPPLEVGPSR